MNIAPVRLSNINFSSNAQKKKQQIDISEPAYEMQNIEPEAQYQDKQLSALQANAGIIPKRQSKIEKLAAEVEKSINSGLEDKIYEYHTFVKQLLAKNTGKENGIFKDSNGVIYKCMHNFHTIQIEQDYKGKSVDSCRYYLGYKDGKLPNASQQTGFIFPAGAYYQFPNGNSIEYNFRDYNLDDEHGCTDAAIDKDGNFVYIDTGHDAFAPVKTRYNYKDGVLKSADVQIYNKCDEKPARLIFDENRKVIKIYYNVKRDYVKNETTCEKIYERKEDGEFVEVEA